jgi:hypothetical protein
MTNTFELLARFLEKYGDEVEGRALEEMPADVKLKLQDFARGKLPASERTQLSQLLKENPKWISLLAGEVKSSRPGASRN